MSVTSRLGHYDTLIVSPEHTAGVKGELITEQPWVFSEDILKVARVGSRALYYGEQDSS